jgi:hypothetical protein
MSKEQMTFKECFVNDEEDKFFGGKHLFNLNYFVHLEFHQPYQSTNSNYDEFVSGLQTLNGTETYLKGSDVVFSFKLSFVCYLKTQFLDLINGKYFS